MEFQVKGGEYLGKLVFDIYHDHVPVTARNFMDLCTANSGLSYKNCSVYRIVKNKYLETGDITKGTGTGGISIYGKSFDEEKHTLQHTKTGKLIITFVNKSME